MLKKILVAFIGIMLASAVSANSSENEYLKQELERLKQQVEALSAMVEKNQQTTEQNKQAVEQTVNAVEENSVVAKVAEKFSKLSIGGYGEHHLEMVRNSESDQIDAHRFVLFVGYQFNDKISFQSELEVEHSLAGEGKPGEVELEQAYINYKLNENHDIKMGQFLIPVGFINETHEPDTFYGVERPRFTSRIVPATWWEMGAMASGRIGESVSYNLAAHSGLDIDNGEGGLDKIRSGRQKTAEAVANDPAYTARLDYSPLPGLTVGTALNYQVDMTQSKDAPEDDVDGLLTSVHASYERGPFGMRAVYGHWDIDTDINPVETQDGYYIEGSYKVTPKLGVFARYSELDWADDIRNGGATTGYELHEEENITVGANYWLHPRVVLKADYQWRETDSIEYNAAGDRTGVEDNDQERDSFNLGIGWSF